MVYSRTLKTSFSKILQHRLDLTTENLRILFEGHYTPIGRNMSQKFQIPLKVAFECHWTYVYICYCKLSSQCSWNPANSMFTITLWLLLLQIETWTLNLPVSSEERKIRVMGLDRTTTVSFFNSSNCATRSGVGSHQLNGRHTGLWLRGRTAVFIFVLRNLFNWKPTIQKYRLQSRWSLCRHTFCPFRSLST